MSIIEENWSYHVNSDTNNESYREFESCLLIIRDGALNETGGFRIQNYKAIKQNQDEDLQLLIESNKQLRQNIESKLNEISEQKSWYENFKKDQKVLAQEIKDTHEAFLMAKKYYKKFLKIYYTIESRSDEKQTIFIQFFTEAKKDSEIYSLRLLRNTISDHYELLETKPKISIVDEMMIKLYESKDLPGILCSIRHAFLELKKNKMFY